MINEVFDSSGVVVAQQEVPDLVPLALAPEVSGLAQQIEAARAKVRAETTVSATKVAMLELDDLRAQQMTSRG